MAVADVNGDHIPDLVTANAGASTVSVVPGGGGGSFRTASSFVVGKRPVSVVVGDASGDGKVDLLFRDASGAFSIWTSTGSGFTPAPTPGGVPVLMRSPGASVIKWLT